MKIKSIKSLGYRQTYSPEMKSEQHNYITPNSSAVHRNSHAVAYCLMAYRCFWLKAHFAPEYWSAVLSGCHPDKLERYLGIARSEEWQPTEVTLLGNVKTTSGLDISTLDINHLTNSFSASRNTITQGLIGVKGIGESAAKIFSNENDRRDYKSLDEFVADPERRIKTVIERFIKLGSFKHLPGHQNSKTLYMYYLYHHASASSKESTAAIKKSWEEALLKHQGWTEKKIIDEQHRQINEYKKLYPKKKAIPKKITNWRPEPSTTLQDFNAAFTEDYSVKERLSFQKEYLGYWVESPMIQYKCKGDRTIEAARKYILDTEEPANIEVVIQDVTKHLTKPTEDGGGSKPYIRLTVTDGIESTTIFIWESDILNQNANILQADTGVDIPVTYNPKKKMFTLVRRGIIRALRMK